MGGRGCQTPLLSLIQQNIDEGRCTLSNPSEMLPRAYAVLSSIGRMVVVHPVVETLRLGCWVGVFVRDNERVG